MLKKLDLNTIALAKEYNQKMVFSYLETNPRFEIGDWWKEEELPFDLSQFGEFKTIAVEVGFGFGEFLFSNALIEKETLFVGIEKYGEGLRKLIDRIKKTNINNIIPLCGDAYVIMQVFFADKSTDKIYVNFPDPWPKKRHQKRRILTEEFFKLAERKLKDNGILYFATDDPVLMEFSQSEIKKVPELKNMCHPDKYLLNSPYRVRTRYENKWIKEHKQLFYFVYGKIDASHKI